VAPEISDEVYFSLRIQDLSRSLLTWGTAIPVVRENHLRNGSVRLLDVPFELPFRQSLRVYAFDRISPGCDQVDVKVFDLQSGETVWTFPLTLTDPTGVTCAVPSSAPNLAEVHSLSAGFEGASPPARVGIEITPRDPELKIWARVTVVNNETQHVTAIVPAE
jgi:hypothetical protein